MFRKRHEKEELCKGLRDWAIEERYIGIGLGMGIRIFVQDKIEDGIPEEIVIDKLIKRFGIGEKEARKHYRKILKQETGKVN